MLVQGRIWASSNWTQWINSSCISSLNPTLLIHLYPAPRNHLRKNKQTKKKLPQDEWKCMWHCPHDEKNPRFALPSNQLWNKHGGRGGKKIQRVKKKSKVYINYGLVKRLTGREKKMNQKRTNSLSGTHSFKWSTIYKLGEGKKQTNKKTKNGSRTKRNPILGNAKACFKWVVFLQSE